MKSEAKKKKKTKKREKKNAQSLMRYDLHMASADIFRGR